MPYGIAGAEVAVAHDVIAVVAGRSLLVGIFVDGELKACKVQLLSGFGERRCHS